MFNPVRFKFWLKFRIIEKSFIKFVIIIFGKMINVKFYYLFFFFKFIEVNNITAE